MKKLITIFFILQIFFKLNFAFSQSENISDQPVANTEPNSVVTTELQPQTLPQSSTPGQYFLDDEEKFIYDPTLKRDPFQIIGIKDIIKKVENLANGNSQTVEQEVTDPLQKSNIEDFKVIGIMWEGQKPKAILQDKSNRNHLVFTGTRLGNKNGYVAMIREGQVVVMEYVDEEGRVVKKPKTLEITRSK